MEKIKKKKLELRRQNIRQLSPAELNQAQGGLITVITITISVTAFPSPAH